MNKLQFIKKKQENFSPVSFKKEPGTLVIDEMASLIVMIFMFVLILTYAGYGKMVQMRLAIDNIAKEYLYQMEQEGYLSNANRILMTEDLEFIGVKEGSVVFDESVRNETNQAAYGDKVTLRFAVTFDNPLYTFISAEEHDNAIFTIMGLNKEITYNVNMSATAKW